MRERGNDDAQRHAANRLSGEHHDALAAITGKTPAKSDQSRSRRFALRLHDHRDDDGEQKLNSKHAEAAERLGR